LTIGSTGGVTIFFGLTLTSGFTLPSSIVTAYTPTVTAGGNLTPNGASTGRYMNLGGFKMAWGEINLSWTATSNISSTTTATLPASFHDYPHLHPEHQHRRNDGLSGGEWRRLHDLIL
jgi:hypothetical protein